MINNWYKKFVNEISYGTECVVLDRSAIREFIDWKKFLCENTVASRINGISDEGLYDFFQGFDDYKRVVDHKAKQIIGWPVINYMLGNDARDPYYELRMLVNTDSSRADSISYGGAVNVGEKNPDAHYMKEMTKIADDLGWSIIKWLGVGPNRQSTVLIIPSVEYKEKGAKLNEDVVIRVNYNEEFGAAQGYLPSPSRKGINKAKKRKDKSIYSEKEGKVNKIIAVYPGRFQPFGPHHKASYLYLKKKFGNVFIVTSNKTGGSRHPMSFAQKKKHMQRMGIPASAIVLERQPYIPKGLLGQYNEDTTAVVFGVGTKDQGRLSGGSYFKKYNAKKIKGHGEHGYTFKIPHISVKVGGSEISGTTMRKLLGSDKFDIKKKEKFFRKMFGYFNQKVFDMFTSSFKEEIKLDIEVGDTILVGKFKNKKMVVKDIGIDKHGMPTVNGRKVTTFRYVKKPNAFTEQRELLLMGGAYGHMSHPFDDYGLTFGDLRNIIEMGLQGKLNKEEDVTEKLDGQNIMVSVVGGEARAARNKGDLKRGGMTLDGVKNKFKHHIPTVRNAFVYSMKDLKTSLEKFNKKDQEAFFDNGKNWANIEIIYPDTKNVIDYDGGAQIIFHGILKYDDNWQPRGEVRSGGARLTTIINKINAGIKTKFAFKGPNVLKIAKAKDFSKKRKKYFSILNNLRNIYRLKDTDEVTLYHQHFWLEFILNGANQTDFPNIPDNVLYPLMKRWAFSDKSYKMTEINKLKEDHPEFVDWVKATEKLDHARMLKQNMRPFEVLFFEVGAEILSNVSNWLAPNPDKTVQALRRDLENAARQIRGKKDTSTLGKLKTQLSKINSMGDLSNLVPSEGLVFKYQGKTYKFTGYFAPINQITGLMKFSR